MLIYKINIKYHRLMYIYKQIWDLFHFYEKIIARINSKLKYLVSLI